MLPDLTDIFASYEQLTKEADALFRHVSSLHPQCSACHPGCSDCCHALFDLSLVEAMYINNNFKKSFPHGLERSRIVEKASTTDRQLTRTKRELYQAGKKGESTEQIMAKASALRMPCPLLDEQNQCLLYEARPITCRLYGIPLAIGNDSHVCGSSGFKQGENYPTVKLDRIQKRLEELSAEIAARIGSRFDLHDVYVPLSMALLTKYDEEYLGVEKDGK